MTLLHEVGGQGWREVEHGKGTGGAEGIGAREQVGRRGLVQGNR